MTTAELNAKVKEIKEMQRMEEEIKQEIASLQDEIKQELTSRGTDTIATNEYKVRWTEVKSSRFDTTLFKAQYSDLYEAFTKQTASRRFSIA